MLENKAALVIDDNRENLLILQYELLRLGFVVTAVSRPYRVRQTLQAMYRVDVVFVDLDMPSFNEHDVLKHLKDAGIDAPVIAHTVHVEQLSRIQEAGFQGLVAKPLDIDRFPEVLQQILAGKHIWRT